MIYVCIPARQHVATVGLVLWKTRQVFGEFPREYHILVVDDASTDGTAETLEAYQGALPLTVCRQESPRGRAACLERLLREALDRTDRPKRDCAVLLPADFSVSPAVIPALVRRFESGADLIVGETVDADPSRGRRLVRRTARWLLRPGLAVSGVRDLTSNVCAVRLVTLRRGLREQPAPFLAAEDVCAHAELVARVAANARQVATVTLAAEAPPHAAADAVRPWRLAVSLFRAGRRLRVPAAAETA